MRNNYTHTHTHTYILFLRKKVMFVGRFNGMSTLAGSFNAEVTFFSKELYGVT